MCSFFEQKLPKLSEEKPSPVVTPDDDDDVVITKMKELTMVRRIVKPFATLKVSFLGRCNEKYRIQFLLKYC